MPQLAVAVPDRMMTRCHDPGRSRTGRDRMTDRPHDEDRQLQHRFEDMLLVERGLSRHTAAAYGSDIRQFSRWLAERGSRLVQVQRDDVLAWLACLLAQGVGARSAARKLSSLRRLYAWLLREQHVSTDPTALVDSPRIGRRLPSSLSEAQVRSLLDAPDVATPLGLRDRTMLEILYGCGLRVSELIDLRSDQVGRQQEVLRVVGKGSKERLLPLGEHAAHWLQRYESEARPQLRRVADQTPEVFLSQRGTALSRQSVWYRIKHHARVAGVPDSLSPHTLRHAFATHLVNHDADLRVVQLLLGHSNLSTTQIYTHVARERLKSLHLAHHPRG